MSASVLYVCACARCACVCRSVPVAGLTGFPIKLNHRPDQCESSVCRNEQPWALRACPRIIYHSQCAQAKRKGRRRQGVQGQSVQPRGGIAKDGQSRGQKDGGVKKEREIITLRKTLSAPNHLEASHSTFFPVNKVNSKGNTSHIRLFFYHNIRYEMLH